MSLHISVWSIAPPTRQICVEIDSAFLFLEQIFVKIRRNEILYMRTYIHLWPFILKLPILGIFYISIYHVLCQLNTQSQLIQTLNGYAQHISVQVNHLQGEHNANF